MQLLKTNAEELEDQIERFQDSIFLNVGPSIKRIALNSILFIKSYGDYMKIRCTDTSYTIYIRMKRLEEALPHNEFLRIHRSYMIRLDKIDKIFTKSLEIDGTNIPISRNLKEDLLKTIPWIK